MQSLAERNPDLKVGPGRPKDGLPALPSISLDSVVVGTHDLTLQSKQLESICRRVGKRLNYWLTRTARLNTAAGNPVDEEPLPSPEFLEAFRYYQAALLGLLKEQRERARLKGDEPTPEQLQAQFRAELDRALASFSPAEQAYAIQLWEANQPNAIAAPKTTETEQ
jgi:hypothetical protein